MHNQAAFSTQAGFFTLGITNYRSLGTAASIRPPQTQPGKVSLDSRDWDIPQTETFAEVYVLWLGIRAREKFSGLPAGIGSQERLRPPGYILHCEMAGL
jgi:hypothetical protein